MIRPHPVRAAVLDALLAEPDAEWTVLALTEALNQAEQVHHQVRELVVLLMHERLLEPVPYQRHLTVRIRNGAETSIRLLRSEWRGAR
jgi:hypothetical protein